MGADICIVDLSGKALLGETPAGSSFDRSQVPIMFEDAMLGFVIGPAASASALALLLMNFAARESESRALASEVLHLYREVHLIEQLSEQLAALLNVSAVGQSALAQAQRLIPATHGGILVMEKEDGPLCSAAAFGPSSNDLVDRIGPLSPDSRFAASILERGIAEIVNDCATDHRALDSERALNALICAPLRAGQRAVGIIALANTAEGASYSAANLKLLNTIALQTAAAIANAFLCAEMVEAARARAAVRRRVARRQHCAATAAAKRLASHARLPGGIGVPPCQRGWRRLLLSVFGAGRRSHRHCGRCLRKGPDRSNARGDDPWRTAPRNLS